MNRLFRRIEEKARDVSQPPVTIVAFGDSVTQGVMEHRVLDGAHVYHRLLQDHLESFFPTTSFSVFNAGVSGDSVVNALGRLDRDVLSRNPDLVLIAFGLNDSLQGEAGLSEFSASLATMIRIIKEKTGAAVLVLTPPFMARKPGPRIHPDHLSIANRILETQNTGMLAQYVSVIRRVAGQQDVPLADVHREWERLAGSGLDTDVWLINGLNHPDPRGHRLTALLVFHTLLSNR